MFALSHYYALDWAVLNTVGLQKEIYLVADGKHGKMNEILEIELFVWWKLRKSLESTCQNMKCQSKWNVKRTEI